MRLINSRFYSQKADRQHRRHSRNKFTTCSIRRSADPHLANCGLRTLPTRARKLCTAVKSMIFLQINSKQIKSNQPNSRRSSNLNIHSR
jgi:hypothetical protein